MRICWGFLRLLGQNGKSNTEKKARIQLYKYPAHLEYVPDKPYSPIVYQCWKRDLQKYPATLYISVKGAEPFEIKNPQQHSVMNEMDTINELAKFAPNSKLKEPLKPKWRRQANEICKLPNTLMYRINGGDQGALECQFSHNGLMLAISSTGNAGSQILLYHFESGQRIAALMGHTDIIYNIVWSANDKMLLSVSSDNTARIWEFQQDGFVKQTQILAHSNFVYSGVILSFSDSEK